MGVTSSSNEILLLLAFLFMRTLDNVVVPSALNLLDADRLRTLLDDL